MTLTNLRRSFPWRRKARACLIVAACASPMPSQPTVAEQPSAQTAGTSAAESQARPASDPGPALRSFEVAQGAILLHFPPAMGDLLLKGPGRGAFQIAGSDGKWLPADAHLANGVVVVSTSLIQQPVKVSYRWQGIASAVLFDGKGLPVKPFQTAE